MQNLKDSLLFAVVAAAVLYVFLSFCPPSRGAQPLPQVALKLPQVSITCPCPDGGVCQCRDSCLCGPTCRCSDCPGKSDPLQLAAKRKGYDNPAYAAAYREVTTKTFPGGHPYYNVFVVYVGQPEVRFDRYWTYKGVSVPSFPGVTAPAVVVSVPQPGGYVERIADLPGKADPDAIYRAWERYMFPRPMPVQAFGVPIVNAVLAPPPMGPMMFQGDCPGGVCRPR